jgi:hypothetical protein
MITVKINVSKIDKTHLFEGKSGKYLDLVLRETPNDKYGNDYMVVQGVSKEARQKGVKGPILGNAKNFGTPPPQQSIPADSEEAF